jgi:hypothetical protein
MLVVDFDKLLQESLLGVNKAFEQADADLHELVATASQALGRVTRGVVEMKLKRHSESIDGLRYDLVVKGQDLTRPFAEGVIVGTYEVSAKGYPVRVGVWEASPARGRLDLEQYVFRATSDLTGKSEMQRHFEELMSNPDSPVVTNAAFFMRRRAAQ